jgi:hypothetical protein
MASTINCLHHRPAMSTHPIIPDRLALEAALMKHLASITTTIERVHDVPALSATELRNLTKSLATYLTFFIAHNKRRSQTPLDPAHLAFHLLRTYNSSEASIDAQGDKTKGAKDWYYLVLTESGSTGDMQILVEGMIRKEKGEVLEGFIEEVDDQVLYWEELEKEEIEKGMESEEMAVWVEMEMEVEEEMEAKKAKRKARGGKGKSVRFIDSDGESGDEEVVEEGEMKMGETRNGAYVEDSEEPEMLRW